MRGIWGAAGGGGCGSGQRLRPRAAAAGRRPWGAGQTRRPSFPAAPRPRQNETPGPPHPVADALEVVDGEVHAGSPGDGEVVEHLGGQEGGAVRR
jgi:hypothetical protein